VEKKNGQPWCQRRGPRRCTWAHAGMRQRDGVRRETGDVGVVGEINRASAGPCFGLVPAEGPNPLRPQPPVPKQKRGRRRRTDAGVFL